MRWGGGGGESECRVLHGSLHFVGGGTLLGLGSAAKLLRTPGDRTLQGINRGHDSLEHIRNSLLEGLEGLFAVVRALLRKGELELELAFLGRLLLQGDDLDGAGRVPLHCIVVRMGLGALKLQAANELTLLLALA